MPKMGMRELELPKMPFSAMQSLLGLAEANLASEFYNRLGDHIQMFDADLDQDQETGIRLVSFGQTITFRVTSIGFQNPSLILFNGSTDDGNKITLIQHVTQISFLLMAMPRLKPDEPKKPFGFAHYEKQE